MRATLCDARSEKPNPRVEVLLRFSAQRRHVHAIPADSGGTANQRTVARPPHLSSPLTILPVDINRYIMNKCLQSANRDNERADGDFNKLGSPIFRRRISEEPSSCSLTAQHLGGYDGLAVAARALGSDLAALTSAQDFSAPK